MSGTLEGAFSDGVEGAFQLGVASEPGVRRVVAYAARAAKARGEKKITLASKSNALPQIYGFWEDVAKDEAAKQGVGLSIVNVDAMCYHLVRTPDLYGVVVAPNMFGDIVSDLLAGLAGGLGVAAGADIGDRLSMFEPIHGSAPDIAGTGKANPIAAILTGALMLEHIGERDAAHGVENALTEFSGPCGNSRPPRGVRRRSDHLRRGRGDRKTGVIKKKANAPLSGKQRSAARHCGIFRYVEAPCSVSHPSGSFGQRNHSHGRRSQLP